MSDKLMYKRQKQQVKKDLDYFMTNYDMSEDEAYEYLNEIYRIRYSITENMVSQIRASNDKNQQPF